MAHLKFCTTSVSLLYSQLEHSKLIRTLRRSDLDTCNEHKMFVDV